VIRRVLALILLLASQTSWGHEVRPGYLLLKQLDAETYEVVWRVPARGDLRLGIYAHLPDSCMPQADKQAWQDGGYIVEHWVARCPGGLTGSEVRIDGLAATLTDVLARVERQDGTTQTARLSPSSPVFTVSATESWQQVAATYTELGIEHILLGIDHLLFILALLMIVAGWRKLVATVTAFTLAHSMTLAAATLGWVHVPQAPVEAVIALSILFVAIEIVHWRQGRPGITRSKPWLVAFTFGLLHGFGFAGALAAVGLPEHAIPLALLFFNLGVEMGQLMFIAAVFAVWSVLQLVRWPHWAWRLPVYGIGATSAFWVIQRIAGFQ